MRNLQDERDLIAYRIFVEYPIGGILSGFLTRFRFPTRPDRNVDNMFVRHTASKSGWRYAVQNFGCVSIHRGVKYLPRCTIHRTSRLDSRISAIPRNTFARSDYNRHLALMLRSFYTKQRNLRWLGKREDSKRVNVKLERAKDKDVA